MSSHTTHEVAEELADELESWKLKHLLTPQNITWILGITILGTIYYMNLSHGQESNAENIQQVKEAVAIEKTRRIEQVREYEKRVQARIDKLETSVNQQFTEQREDLKDIQNMLIELIRRNGD